MKAQSSASTNKPDWLPFWNRNIKFRPLHNFVIKTSSPDTFAKWIIPRAHIFHLAEIEVYDESVMCILKDGPRPCYRGGIERMRYESGIDDLQIVLDADSYKHVGERQTYGITEGFQVELRKLIRGEALRLNIDQNIIKSNSDLHGLVEVFRKQTEMMAHKDETIANNMASMKRNAEELENNNAVITELQRVLKYNENRKNLYIGLTPLGHLFAYVHKTDDEFAKDVASRYQTHKLLRVVRDVPEYLELKTRMINFLKYGNVIQQRSKHDYTIKELRFKADLQNPNWRYNKVWSLNPRFNIDQEIDTFIGRFDRRFIVDKQ